MFCVTTKPIAPVVAKQRTVLFVQPFAEELNRSRRFLSLLRGRLSSEGATVVQPDVYGTGDSTGDLADTSIDIWINDLVNVLENQSNGGTNKITLLGVRAGCLLIESMIRTSARSQVMDNVDSIVYLQPELQGFDAIQRMLRARVTAKRFAGQSTEPTEALWAQLEAGSVVSAMGYDIGAKLALDMRELTIDPQIQPLTQNACWLSLDENAVFPQIHHAWRVRNVSSKPFWQLHEHEPELHTINRVAKCALEFNSESTS